MAVEDTKDSKAAVTDKSQTDVAENHETRTKIVQGQLTEAIASSPTAMPKVSEVAQMEKTGWNPTVGDAHITSPEPLYRAGTDKPGEHGDPAADAAAIKTLRESHPDIDKQATNLERQIASMPASMQADARRGLDQLLLRATQGYDSTHADKEVYPPALKEAQVEQTLENLNKIMSTDSAHLNQYMGSDRQAAGTHGLTEREMARDLVVSQALSDFGDPRGIQQFNHETCLIDGKIKDEARRSPETSSAALAAAMTSRDGNVKMPDGTVVKVNDINGSFMRPDAYSLKADHGDNAMAMSADTRILTGLYANALTQHKDPANPRYFVMSSDDSFRPAFQGDSGDRLVNADGTSLAINGRPVDSPMVGARDADRLNAMTRDHGIIATNGAAWNGAGSDDANYRNIQSADQLAQLVAANGSVQVIGNAHILFNDGHIGADGGGHETSITQTRMEGGHLQFYVQDTNHGTSGWYDADRVMAAINNDKGFRVAGRAQETAPVLSDPRFQTHEQEQQRTQRLIVDQQPAHEINPRGVVPGDNTLDKELQKAKPDKELDKREKEYKHLLEEQNRAALWLQYQQDLEEADKKRRQQQMVPIQAPDPDDRRHHEHD